MQRLLTALFIEMRREVRALGELVPLGVAAVHDFRWRIGSLSIAGIAGGYAYGHADRRRTDGHAHQRPHQRPHRPNPHSGAN